MGTVALVPHTTKPEAKALALEAIAWLEAHDHDVRVPEDDARATDLLRYAWPVKEIGAGLDLAVSLGGDGTILRTVDLVIGSDVPVLGINVGQMGYLTEMEPAGLETALDRFFLKEFQLEERMTLEVEVVGQATWLALNEAVLEKTVAGHTVRVAIAINEREFTTAAADGMIVATPTGSTAYNLSARGPIVSPRHRALVVTPVSPHMLFDRSLVLGADESVHLEVLESRPAALVVDGRTIGTLAPGDTVICRAGAHDARFVRFHDRDFHQILKAKFGLADR